MVRDGWHGGWHSGWHAAVTALLECLMPALLWRLRSSRLLQDPMMVSLMGVAAVTGLSGPGEAGAASTYIDRPEIHIATEAKHYAVSGWTPCRHPVPGALFLYDVESSRIANLRTRLPLLTRADPCCARSAGRAVLVLPAVPAVLRRPMGTVAVTAVAPPRSLRTLSTTSTSSHGSSTPRPAAAPSWQPTTRSMACPATPTPS